MRNAMLAMLMAIAGSVAAVAQGLPAGKPEPLPPAQSVAPQQEARPRCAQPLMDGCVRMQSSCQMACPGMWSTNPSARAFTPTDRAGCLARCGSQYRMCVIQYGCL